MKQKIIPATNSFIKANINTGKSLNSNYLNVTRREMPSSGIEIRMKKYLAIENLIMIFYGLIICCL